MERIAIQFIEANLCLDIIMIVFLIIILSVSIGLYAFFYGIFIMNKATIQDIDEKKHQMSEGADKIIAFINYQLQKKR